MASAEAIRRERMKRVKAADANKKNTLALLKSRLHIAIESTINSAANHIFVDAVKRAPQRKVFKGAGAGGKDRFGIPTISHGGRNQTRAAVASDLNYAGSNRAGRALAKKGSDVIVTRRSRMHGDNPRSNAFEPSYRAEQARARKEYDADFILPREVNVGSRGRILGMSDERVEGALTNRAKYDLRTGRGVFSVSGGRDKDTGRISGGIDRPSSEAGLVTLGGRLKKEIFITPLMHRGNTTFRRVVSPTRYAKYVEFGTRYAAAQPYLRPALAQQYSSFVSVLQKNINKAGSELRGVGAKAETTGIVGNKPRKNWGRTRLATVGQQKVSRADIEALERAVRITGGGGFR